MNQTPLLSIQPLDGSVDSKKYLQDFLGQKLLDGLIKLGASDIALSQREFEPIFRKYHRKITFTLHGRRVILGIQDDSVRSANIHFVFENESDYAVNSISDVPRDDTFPFMKAMSEILTVLVPDDLQLVLSGSTEKRNRIYKKFVEKANRPNIIMDPLLEGGEILSIDVD